MQSSVKLHSALRASGICALADNSFRFRVSECRSLSVAICCLSGRTVHHAASKANRAAMSVCQSCANCTKPLENIAPLPRHAHCTTHCAGPEDSSAIPSYAQSQPKKGARAGISSNSFFKAFSARRPTTASANFAVLGTSARQQRWQVRVAAHFLVVSGRHVPDPAMHRSFSSGLSNAFSPRTASRRRSNAVSALLVSWLIVVNLNNSV